MIRYVITHRSDKLELRTLTFAKQGRFTHPTREAADRALDAFRGPEGLARVLSPTECSTLRVCAAECYEHGDPIGSFFNEDAK